MELRSGTVVAPPGHAQSSGSANGSSGQLSEEGAALFHQGVGLVLHRWTALQLAIHNEWGGPSSQLKAQQLHNDIVHWLLKSKAPRYLYELEDLLDENLVQQFNMEIEDGSLEEVAEKLMSMYEECLEGNFDTIKELTSTSSSVASQSALNSQRVEAEEYVSSTTLPKDNGADCMDLDPPQDDGMQASVNEDNHSLPIEDVEADGWQLVSSKSKRKPRKN